jgi:hypothetical protein
MHSPNTVTVRTAEQPVSAIGERMANMRTWLDQRGIQLADFEPVSLGFGTIAFDACFRDAAEADLFWAAFG